MISPARTGSSRPRRSDQRPSRGLCTAPSPALASQNTVIPSAPTPTASRLSGPSTVRQPNSSAGSAISQTPETTFALRRRREEQRERLAERAARRGHASRPDCEHDAEARDARERDGPARELRGASDERPQQRARHGCPERDAEHLAPPLGRRRGREPREAARPRDRSARSLGEAQSVQQPHVIREAEAGAAHREDEHSHDRRHAEAHARRQPRAAQRPDRAACGIRAVEEADAGLREPELARQIGQQWRECGEEQRLHQDDGAHEHEKTPVRHGRQRRAAVVAAATIAALDRRRGSII